MKWEFELDLNTEGGLELSNRLKQKELALNFDVRNDAIYTQNFPSLLKTSPSEVIPFEPGDIIVNSQYFCFALVEETHGYQKIGKLINMEGFSAENILPFSQDGLINLVLSYEKIEELKIAEINKKIINIIFIGFILLIILLIIKLIFKWKTN